MVLTLGYDVPWRKVEQVLIEAAQAISGILEHRFSIKKQSLIERETEVWEETEVWGESREVKLFAFSFFPLFPLFPHSPLSPN